MIRVLSKGFASVQDLGRFGFRQKGIPYAGVMDVDAFHLCNALLGNDENVPVVEYFKQGLKIQAIEEFSFCIIGQVEHVLLNDQAIHTGRIYTLKPNDVLDTGKVKGGTFAYLGIPGEYKGQEVLGSCSESAHLLMNAISELSFETRDVSYRVGSRLSPKFITKETVIIECFVGPEWSNLLTEVKEKIRNETFHLSRETWRMAFKLQEKIPNKIPVISSSPVLPGTVQLTPAGDIVILMRDAQTTGGYPRILQLTEDAINKLCRVGWGGEIKFDVYL